MAVRENDGRQGLAAGAEEMLIKEHRMFLRWRIEFMRFKYSLVILVNNNVLGV